MDREFGPSMTTREKMGNITKRFIYYFYRNRTKIHKIQDVITKALKILPDSKKILDILFILQGLGIIMRISKNKMIFIGLQGMANQITQIIKKRFKKLQQTSSQLFTMDLDKTDKQVYMFADEIFYDKRYINIKSSIQLGIYARDIFGHLVLSSNRQITRTMMEQSLEQYVNSVKDAFTKNVVNDLINIFVQLNLAKQDSNDTVCYIGHECLNQRRITYDQIKNLKEENINQVIQDCEQTELVFFNQMLKVLYDDQEKMEYQNHLNKINNVKIEQQQQQENKQINDLTQNNNLRQLLQQQDCLPVNSNNDNTIQKIKNLSNTNNNNNNNNNNNSNVNQNKNLPQYNLQMDVQKVPHSHLSYFPKSAFAMLKGKTWSYLIQKLQIIIGKSPQNFSQDSYKWHTDLEITNSKRVSRQHAIILYNFTKETFEIKCISKKFIIKVNHGLYNYKDKPVPLKNKSLITIGGEHFKFFLPNTSDQQDDKQENNQTKKEEDEDDNDDNIVDEGESEISKKQQNNNKNNEQDDDEDDEIEDEDEEQN